MIKEYLDTTTPAGEEAVGYEQVFGKVEADGTITDRLEIDGELTDTQNPDLRDDLDNCLIMEEPCPTVSWRISRCG